MIHLHLEQKQANNIIIRDKERNEKERKEREKHQQASWNTPILIKPIINRNITFSLLHAQWVKSLRLSNYKIERSYQI